MTQPAGVTSGPAISGPATSDAATPESAPRNQTRPWTVLVAAATVAAEAVGVLVASILAAVSTAQGQAYETASGIAISIIGFGAAALLALVARGLQRGRPWSRTPAMLTELFAGIVAIYLLQSGRLDWGVPWIVLAVAGFAALLTPASLRCLSPIRARQS